MPDPMDDYRNLQNQNLTDENREMRRVLNLLKERYTFQEQDEAAINKALERKES